MKLSRQHFQMIAEVLQEAYTSEGEGVDKGTVGYLTDKFADRLRETNGMFNRDRFIDVATGERQR